MKDWALILGASNGIGKATAIRLAKNGINIYGLFLRSKKNDIEELISDLKQYGVDVIYRKANASNEDSRKDIINELVNMKNIRIKMFIHSIAFGALKKMIDASASALNKKNIDMTLDVMCNNLIYWTQDLHKHKLLNKGSHVLSMTSAGGNKNWQNYGAVSLAKAGIESITRQLSIELAPYGISANAIQAGVTETKALKKIPNYTTMIEKSKSANPHKRLTTTEDVAEFIETLLKYESSWMTGNVIRVDGGEDITN